MLAFAIKAAKQLPKLMKMILEPCAHGFGDEDIWDIGAIAALFAVNRMASMAAMRPNDEFCTMGRDF